MLAYDASQAAVWRELRRQVVAGRTDGSAEKLLREAADASRARLLTMIRRAGLGHVGGDLSVIDILTTLFVATLRIDPARPDDPGRDRFILSKGHCSAALYTTLAHAGFFPPAALDDFMRPLSPLNGHPNRTNVPGVETNTGPLGHGLPVAVGCALGALRRSSEKVFVVLGDGEMQEGSNWEAIMYAGHRRLGNLTAVVDRNRLQQGARTEDTNGLDPLDDRWRAFGWNVVELDGHDHAALMRALGTHDGERRVPADTAPLCVIANTVKGKGVSFMEDRVEWHHKVPSQEQVDLALAELAR